MACPLSFTLQRLSVFFTQLCSSRGTRVRRERLVAKARQRAKSLLYRKLYANATGMQNAGTRANICALAPSLSFRPGGTERIYRDRGDGVIMELMVVYV